MGTSHTLWKNRLSIRAEAFSDLTHIYFLNVSFINLGMKTVKFLFIITWLSFHKVTAHFKYF